MTMIPGGELPNINDFDPEVQEAILITMEQTGMIIRQRCCMPALARATTCKWRHKPVTASIQGSLPGLSESQVKSTYQKALDVWNASCNVGLVWTDSFNTANIWARCQKIDGASGTLAWSYLIQCGGGTTQNTQLEQRYDNSERWTVDWFLEVCLHEIGHALGLDHINNPKALMNPYSAGGKILTPTTYELEIMVPLYGAPVISVPPAAIHIIGGGLIVNDGTSVFVDGSSKFEYAGKKFQINVSPAS